MVIFSGEIYIYIWGGWGGGVVFVTSVTFHCPEIYTVRGVSTCPFQNFHSRVCWVFVVGWEGFVLPDRKGALLLCTDKRRFSESKSIARVADAIDRRSITAVYSQGKTNRLSTDRRTVGWGDFSGIQETVLQLQ